MGFLERGKLVGVDDSAGLLQSIDGRVEAIGHEEGTCLFFVWLFLKWKKRGGEE